MRLRSSQFVFLLLLLCSVQIGEDCIRQLAAAKPSYSSATVQRDERIRPAAPRPLSSALARQSCTPATAKAVAIGRVPSLTVRPAAYAAAIAHHTGLLRA